ncbi:hypothetical protein H6P81_009893 [Aristolochia fimbriata]|uniref:Cytochrome P450 n=1 Tax=Aristolochia fimbriata TaxID=158543 RepID=A0AAV7ERN5_ARIFI|nr:hypothetical protein H6P81_009893 [Aristolochia fimbriata]
MAEAVRDRRTSLQILDREPQGELRRTSHFSFHSSNSQTLRRSCDGIHGISGKTSVTWFQRNPRVTVMEPDLVREVLSNKFGHFQKPRSNALLKQLVSGLADHEREKWAKHRRITNPSFHVEKLKRMLPSFASSCSDLM